MRTRHACILGIASLAFSVGVTPGAWAGAPTDQLRDGIDRVFTILRDPGLAGDTNASERRTAILSAATRMFDFGEMAKRALGSHWTARTPAERRHFVALFTELVQHSYIATVDQHGAATVVFRGETVDGEYAAVQTAVPLKNGREMPLEYRMHNADARWQVYDIGIDGMSLVSNYRAQFNRVIRTASYDALVVKLTSHLAEFSASAGARSGQRPR